MRHFLRILDGIDVVPVLAEIARQPELWNQYPVRTFHERTAHKGLDDILLRYNAFDPATDDFVDKVCSSIEVVNYPASQRLPAAYMLALALMGRVRGEHLGRVFISRIPPGGGIPPHSDRIGPAEEAFPDRIAPAVYYQRYAVPLVSDPGCVFRIGNEQMNLKPGEVWWINNQVEHEVLNGSGADRLSLVVDIRSAGEAYHPPSWEGFR